MAAVIVFACSAPRQTINRDISSQYTISDASPLPSYQLYHFTTDSIRIYFSIPIRAYQPKEGDPQTSVPGSYRMHFLITSKFDQRAITDSITLYFNAASGNGEPEIKGTAGLHCGDPAGKVLLITLEDLAKGKASEQLFELAPSYPPGRTHFLLTDVQGNPLSTRHIPVNTKFIIRSSIIGNQMLKLQYLKDVFPAAAPPFVTIPFPYLPYRPDSTGEITFTNGHTPIMELTSPGVYHIATDTQTSTGYTLFVRESTFPWITRSQQMVAPLRYITSNKEFEALLGQDNPKEAVDQFWLKQAGNEFRARKLIREYYRRVEKANYLFTSYQDGWKTDRGMIYIMYGPPNLVERSETSEVWTYGASRNLLSLTFVFFRMNNPFTDNDYQLERSANYKASWYQMVNSWRR